MDAEWRPDKPFKRHFLNLRDHTFEYPFDQCDCSGQQLWDMTFDQLTHFTGITFKVLDPTHMYPHITLQTHTRDSHPQVRCGRSHVLLEEALAQTVTDQCCIYCDVCQKTLTLKQLQDKRAMVYALPTEPQNKQNGWLERFSRSHWGAHWGRNGPIAPYHAVGSDCTHLFINQLNDVIKFVFDKLLREKYDKPHLSELQEAVRTETNNRLSRSGTNLLVAFGADNASKATVNGPKALRMMAETELITDLLDICEPMFDALDEASHALVAFSDPLDDDGNVQTQSAASPSAAPAAARGRGRGGRPPKQASGARGGRPGAS